MKIRNGFVSNSSSSSFCIVGIRNDFDNIQNILEQHKNEIEKEFGSFEESERYEYFEFLCGKSKLNHVVSWECEAYWLGQYVSKMRDDQTLEDFKKETCDRINEETGTNYDWKDMKIIVEEVSN